MSTMKTIGKQISTTINKNPSSDGDQLVTHILMYIEIRAYKREILHDGDQYANRHIPSPRLPIAEDSEKVTVHRSKYNSRK